MSKERGLMSHTIIDLPPVGDDGRLYRDTALNFVESLIPNPWNSCHAPDLLELENGDLLCCWFAGSCEGNADVSIAVSRQIGRASCRERV